MILFGPAFGMAFAACPATPPAEPDGVGDDALCCGGGSARRCCSADASCVTSVAKNRKQQSVIERFKRARFLSKRGIQAVDLSGSKSSRKWGEHSTLAIFGGPERQSEARQTVPRSLRPMTQATIFSERLEGNPPVLISVQQREPPAVRSALFQERSRALHRACAHT